MKKLAKVLALVLALTMVLSMFGCKTADTTATDKPADTETTQPADTATTETAETDGTTAPETETTSRVVTGDPKYDDMTADALYELAKAEGGSIVVYAETSKISKIADAFTAAYPDLTLEYSNIKASEIGAKIPTEIDTGNRTADVIVLNDANGMIYNEWYDDGYVEAYFPSLITSHIDPAMLKEALPLYIGTNPWFYNTTMYPDGSPIDNWWDVVSKNEDGTQKYQIFCKDMAGETSYLALYSQLAADSDKLAAAYKEKYGSDLEYTYDATKANAPENNAACEWLYRFAQMNITFIEDGDDIMKAVNDNTTPCLGLASANKLDNRDDNGYTIAWVTNIAPFTGIMNPCNVYVVKDTDNPAGARLLIQFMMGGENCDTKAMSVFSRLGNWFIRDDVAEPANDIAYTDFGLVVPDSAYIYENYLTINDFWVYWYDSFH